jgi:hypothetical protein
MRLLSILRAAFALAAVAMFAADAEAGCRFRGRRGHGCTPAAPALAAPAQAAQTHYATAYPAAAAGCVNGKCPLK